MDYTFNNEVIKVSSPAKQVSDYPFKKKNKKEFQDTNLLITFVSFIHNQYDNASSNHCNDNRVCNNNSMINSN